MTDYIQITRWEDFQHYSKRDPIWIKVYTRLHSDDAWLSLTGHRRAILFGLWVEYARSSRQLPNNTAVITRRLNLKVTRRDLEHLKTLGFITYPLATRYQDASPETETKTEKPKAVTSLVDVRAEKAEANSLRESIEKELGRLRADG